MALALSQTKTKVHAGIAAVWLGLLPIFLAPANGVTNAGLVKARIANPRQQPLEHPR